MKYLILRAALASVNLLYLTVPLAAQPVELGRPSLIQVEEPMVRTPDFHGHDPLGAECAWFAEFKRDISSEPVDSHSDQMLERLRKAKGTIDAQWSGSWTPSNWNWYTTPFQVVSGNTSPLLVPGTWSYNAASTGPYLLPPEPVVYESSLRTNYATSPWKDGADHHLFIYVRDEGSGGLKELWEYYQPWVTWTDTHQIAAIAGASWRRFDLLHGETPAAGVPSTDAAGMMFMPLVVRYDEVARGAIHHALRFCVNNSDISPTYKWPARTAAGAWNPDTGMPYGTRLRIKASWWETKADTVLGRLGHARIIGEALRRYGCLLADGSGGSTIQLCGVADLRWEKTLHDRLNSIPITAMEVVETPPALRIVGPIQLTVGQVGSWTLTFLPDDSPVGEGSNVNIFDQNGKLVKYQFATIDAKHRSATAHYHFDQAGVYTIKPYQDWNTGFGRFRVHVQAVASVVR